MMRYLIALPLLGALAAADVSAPAAQPRLRENIDISGIYVNRANGGTCEVIARGRHFVFENENGERTRFAFTGARTLEYVSGKWDPRVSVTVLPDRRGGVRLRFDHARGGPALWVPADY